MISQCSICKEKVEVTPGYNNLTSILRCPNYPDCDGYIE